VTHENCIKFKCQQPPRKFYWNRFCYVLVGLEKIKWNPNDSSIYQLYYKVQASPQNISSKKTVRKFLKS
jgi:hypothetical protein